MTPENLRALLAGGETIAVEFKDETREPLNDRDLVQAVSRPECLPFHFHEMQALQADRGLLDYSALTLAEAQWEDLDPLEFARFRRSIRESEGLGDSSLLNLSDLELAK